jgi:subfamily B ATP-binding cassette protein MsbA
VTPLAYVGRQLRPEAWSLVGAAACMLVLAVATGLLAFLSGPALQFAFSGSLTNVLQTSGGQLRQVWRLLPQNWVEQMASPKQALSLYLVPCLLVGTALIKGLAQTAQLFLLGRSSQRLLHRLRRAAFDALLHQSPCFFTSRPHGDLLSRLGHDAAAIEQALYNGAGPLLRDGMTVLMLLGFCMVADSRLALLTLCGVPLAMVPLTRLTRWLKRVSKRSQADMGRLNQQCHETLSGISVVQAFGGEGRELQQLSGLSAQYMGQMRLAYFIRAVRAPATEILGTSALAGLLVMLGQQVRLHGADPAHYISFFAAMIMLYEPLKKLGAVSDYLAAGSAAAERLLELEALPSPVRDRPDAHQLPAFSRCIELQQVHFAYRAEQPVLRGVDLRLEQGEVVALVGASGAGKSTLAQLLPRFYQVSAGQILIDGHDVRDLSARSLRAQISTVGQESFLFNASVAQNIAYGCPDASFERIVAAARAANAAEFIDRLPQAYDTEVGERGIMLSGGQRQRLAIARALLCDRPILILDEATSHLDVESERHVQAGLQALLRGRTALIIAHRLSTVQRADRIAVLRDGQIVEQGSHASLLAAAGAYARLHGMQGDPAHALQT